MSHNRDSKSGNEDKPLSQEEIEALRNRNKGGGARRGGVVGEVYDNKSSQAPSDENDEKKGSVRL